LGGITDGRCSGGVEAGFGTGAGWGKGEELGGAVTKLVLGMFRVWDVVCVEFAGRAKGEAGLSEGGFFVVAEEAEVGGWEGSGAELVADD
jgi:hypothetical protein